MHFTNEIIQKDSNLYKNNGPQAANPGQNRYNFKTIARLACVQSVYLSRISGDDLELSGRKILEMYSNTTYLLEDKMTIKTPHFSNLLKVVHENHSSIDDLISENVKQDIHELMRSVLIVGLAEIIYLGGNLKIIVNEFTNIANSFLPQIEVGLINSVLDNFGKNHLKSI